METDTASSSVVVADGATSGLTINLHPLAILNISDHYTRARLVASKDSSPKLIGALLGQQNGREVSIVNSFELVYLEENGELKIDEEFFTTRSEQFSQVFPTQSVVGWYSIGGAPTAADVAIHAQVVASDAGPSIFALFNPDIPDDTQVLPFTVYESALTEGGEGGKFVQLECGVETGEAERIAVDGVTKEVGGDGDTSGQVGSLSMQRNAIAMLYNRIAVLVKYIQGVIDNTAKVDQDILRQISALVATLPVMDAAEFRAELQTEHNDVQLTDYLTTLLGQLESFSDYTDKHLSLHPGQSDDFGGVQSRGFKPGFAMGGPGGMPGGGRRHGRSGRHR